MFTKKLETAFISIIVFAILILTVNWYSSNSFKNNPLPEEYKQMILQKEQEILHNMQKHYGFAFKVPLIITGNFKNRLYGATTYNNGDIKIYLNKNVMRESMKYMVDNVIAHEYAHALMFKMKVNMARGDGHSRQWKEACIKLGGLNCEQYVDTGEVIMGKLPF